ncbi:MAG: ABC transporter ATP-binding protein [Sulfolobales archaeon]
MEGNEYLLSIKSLTIGYLTEKGILKAVKDVDLYVGRGEGVCVVGESGSGKTTLANAILGILPPNAIVLGGSIVFEGIDLLRVDQRLRASILGVKIGLVPQNPSSSLNPILRIEDQFCEILKYRRGIKDRHRCREITEELLSKTGIRDPDRVMKQYPHQLSGGMKQRVLIAMALSTSPKLIVADEPTSMLDATIQAQILDVLSDIKRGGLSILMITHDLGVAERICERIYIMYYGEIMEFGSVDKIMSKPLHPYTKMLLEHAFLGFKSSGRKETQYRGVEDLKIYGNEDECIFSPRCPYAFNRCFVEKPKMLGDSNSGVKCFLY